MAVVSNLFAPCSPSHAYASTLRSRGWRARRILPGGSSESWLRCAGGSLESSNISVRAEKEEKVAKKDEKDHKEVMDTAEALNNWQKAGGPVVVAVES